MPRRICACEHEYQDKTYGYKVRIMNVTKNGTAVRCTVCKKEYELSSKEIKKAKESENDSRK